MELSLSKALIYKALERLAVALFIRLSAHTHTHPYIIGCCGRMLAKALLSMLLPYSVKKYAKNFQNFHRAVRGFALFKC